MRHHTHLMYKDRHERIEVGHHTAMNRPIMHTASAPARDAASASAGRFADSPVAYPLHALGRLTHTGHEFAQPHRIGLLRDCSRRRFGRVRRADIQLEHPQSGASRCPRQVLRPIGAGEHDAGRDETILARRIAIDCRYSREPFGCIALRQSGAAKDRHAMRHRRTGGVQLRVVGAIELACGRRLLVHRLGDHARHAGAQGGADAGFGHHGFAGTADHRVRQPQLANGRHEAGCHAASVARRVRLPSLDA